jgi:hypothetical protein
VTVPFMGGPGDSISEVADLWLAARPALPDRDMRARLGRCGHGGHRPAHRSRPSRSTTGAFVTQAEGRAGSYGVGHGPSAPVVRTFVTSLGVRHRPPVTVVRALDLAWRRGSR